MKIITPLAAACLLALPSAAGADTAQARPEAVIPFTTVAGGGQTMEGELDGKKATFLFDSGWGVSAISPEFAAIVGCRPWARLTGFRGTGERVDLQQCQPATAALAGHSFRLDTLSLLDLMRFMPKSEVTYQGALGLDAFDGKAITIQSRAGRLVLESRQSLAQRAAHAHEVPVRLVREAQGASLTVDLGMPTPHGMAWLELDTGNGSPVLIGKHVAPEFGLEESTTETQLLRAEIIPGVALDAEAYVVDLIMDGIIGRTFLGKWDLTLDLGQGRGWLAPAAP